MIPISLKDVNNTIKDIFNETTIQSVDSIYDKQKNGYKLVIDIKNLYLENTNVIFTKLIFNVDNTKTYLLPTDENFQMNYLYDINCNYKVKMFDNLFDLKQILSDIFNRNQFGKDIKLLSEFIKSPGTLINEWFSNNDIRNISVYNVKLNFLTKITPCKSLSFNFIINLNNQIDIDFTINKQDETEFEFIFKIHNDTIKEIRSDLRLMIQVIGETLKTKYV